MLFMVETIDSIHTLFFKPNIKAIQLLMVEKI